MTELKCPFCNQKLEPIGTSGQFQCGTWGCDASFNFIATRDVWEYIERTRKALDVAINAMKSAGTHNSINCIARGEDPSKDDVGTTINHALNKITALEQKDVK